MTKVKVNKVIAKRLGGLLSTMPKRLHSAEWLTLSFLKKLHNDLPHHKSLEMYFEENNTTIGDIEQAIKHGWEEMYEFKAGDVVKIERKHGVDLYREVKEIHPDGFIKMHTGGMYNINAETFTLVSKLENRED